MAAPRTRYEKLRAIALAAYFGSSLLLGVADVLLSQNAFWVSNTFLFQLVVQVLAISLWCHFDAAAHRYRLGGGLRALIVVIAAIGVPVYLVKARGWAGAAKIGFGLPAFLLSVGVYYVGWQGAFWVAEKTGAFGS